jgi:hypothetical protein
MPDDQPGDELVRQRRKRSRKRGGLFITDTELIELLGVPVKEARVTIRGLDRDPRSGFPKKQKLWGNRRYFPAVEAWLDGLYKPKYFGASGDSIREATRRLSDERRKPPPVEGGPRMRLLDTT